MFGELGEQFIVVPHDYIYIYIILVSHEVLAMSKGYCILDVCFLSYQLLQVSNAVDVSKNARAAFFLQCCTLVPRLTFDLPFEMAAIRRFHEYHIQSQKGLSKPLDIAISNRT